MKKILLSILLITSNSFYGQEVIYKTTHAGTTYDEITPTANGPAFQMGDSIVIVWTARYLNSITVDLFNLNDATPFSVTMTLYSDCPTVTGAGACGSGIGTLIPGSSVTVNVTAPPATLGTVFEVVFPYSGLDLSGQTDNGITVMINASRANVFWILGETPTIGSMPAGETGFGFATRCGSSGTNNGCARNFGIANNFAMTIDANLTLSSENFGDNSLDKIALYPNPVISVLSISNANIYEIRNVFVTDINGRKIKIQSDSFSEIDVSDLNSGVYFLTIETDEGKSTKKFIKQ
mgnify:FL=1